MVVCFELSRTKVILNDRRQPIIKISSLLKNLLWNVTWRGLTVKFSLHKLKIEDEDPFSSDCIPYFSHHLPHI